jgi:hypothetical protein
VEPLYDHYDRGLPVVETVRLRLANEPRRLLALGVTLGLDDVIGFVEQDGSPRSPVETPPTELASLNPAWLFSSRRSPVLVIWDRSLRL